MRSQANSIVHSAHDDAKNSRGQNHRGFVFDKSGSNWDEDALNAILFLTQTDEPWWLQHSSSFRADLAGADLSHADLCGADLSNADLHGTRLDRANLEGADLRDADLRSAHLGAAKMTNTMLAGAVFDQWTQLPFGKKEALRKGMIYLELAVPLEPPREDAT